MGTKLEQLRGELAVELRVYQIMPLAVCGNHAGRLVEGTPYVVEAGVHNPGRHGYQVQFGVSRNRPRRPVEGSRSSRAVLLVKELRVHIPEPVPGGDGRGRLIH